MTAEAGTARNTDLSAAASAKEEADVRPDMPAAQDWIEQIRAYGHKLIAGGAGMVQTIRILCDRTGLPKQDFADLIGTSRTTVSLALNGKKVRETLIRKLAEFFMIDNTKED